MSRVKRLNPRAIEFIERWPLFDGAIVQHHFTPYMRDYDVIVEAGAAAPDGSGSYLEGRYRFRFTHCVVANVMSTVGDITWAQSWSQEYADYGAWERAGEPRGYVWGVEFMQAYPGARYLPDSDLAADWARRLGHAMHEVEIRTNAHLIQLVFHRLLLHKVAAGDPVSRALTEIEPLEMLGNVG
jgi:hypothetical protein